MVSGAESKSIACTDLPLPRSPLSIQFLAPPVPSRARPGTPNFQHSRRALQGRESKSDPSLGHGTAAMVQELVGQSILGALISGELRRAHGFDHHHPPRFAAPVWAPWEARPCMSCRSVQSRKDGGKELQPALATLVAVFAAPSDLSGAWVPPPTLQIAGPDAFPCVMATRMTGMVEGSPQPREDAIPPPAVGCHTPQWQPWFEFCIRTQQQPTRPPHQALRIYKPPLLVARGARCRT